ncbi:ROK family protein [Enterococcus sp. CSURQ0835]|uniref:ROK family protein n=1 Tax=Enterococcus sp. CSURQ0835 TaxID=2681394 RepID=UPI001356FF16|nr:ROK family protein [Enterococcus sp. CSURQ0835]
MKILTIDIGGSSVKSALFDQTLSDIRRFDSPADWETMRQKLDQLIQSYLRQAEVAAISFSVPGIPNQATGEIEGASSLRYLHGFDFRGYFQAHYPLPIFFENDANCGCIAELQAGAAKDLQSVLFLVIGTGIGGALVVDKKILPGAHRFGGEFGMMLMEHDGQFKEWSELGSAVHMGRKFSQLKGKTYQGTDVFELAAVGDERAQTLCEELYHYLALGIYNLQYSFDPQAFVLSGGIVNQPELLANISRKLQVIMGYGQRCPIVPQLRVATFGSQANLIGAGLVAQTEKIN